MDQSQEYERQKEFLYRLTKAENESFGQKQNKSELISQKNRFDFEESINLPPMQQSFSESENYFIIPPQSQKYPKKQKQSDDVSKFIFESKKIKKQNKNTPRFLMRIALHFLPLFKEHYPNLLGDLVGKECKKLSKWHLKKKKNVFLISHLQYFFDNDDKFTGKGSQLNRRFFNKILRENGLKMMEEPKPENRVDYLRCVKIFALRCHHKGLVSRNQCQ